MRKIKLFLKRLLCRHEWRLYHSVYKPHSTYRVRVCKKCGASKVET